MAGSVINTAQTSVTNAATQIIGSNTNRLGLIISNTDAANTVFIGPTNAVTATNGHAIPPGQSFSYETIAGQAGNYTGAWFGITSSATVKVTSLEESSS